MTDRFSDFFLEDADPASLMNYIRKLKGNVQQQGLSMVDINIIDFLPPSITQIINNGGAGDVVGPASSIDGDIVLFDGTTGKLIKDGGAIAAAVDAAGAVMNSDFDANTILAATADNTPAALTVAEQTLVGRITGGAIDDLSAATVRTLLNVADGATANTLAVADLGSTAETVGGSAANGIAATASRSDHKHAITNPKIDDLATPDDNTDLNASTSAHGLVVKATAPAAGLYNYVGITNGETTYTNKALFDATDPSTQAFGDSAVVGTATVAARRDHKHAMPASPATPKLDDLASPDDNTDLNASTTAHGLLLKATAPAANELNVVGIANGETVYANKDLFNTTTPNAVGTGAAGTAVQASRSDHVHGPGKLDDNTAPDDNTDLNATTSAHGLLLKATAPAAGLYNYVGITNGETAYTNKALFDATDPSTQAFGDSAVVGTATVAARRDHKHAMPATPAAPKLDDNAAPDDNTDLNATTSAHGLAPKAVAPAANELNVLGIANGETAYANKDLFNTTTPNAIGTAAAGTAVQAARSDHTHTISLSGDVTTSSGVATTIANDAVTYAKMQNVSATDKVLGRASAGSGDVEEIACTSAGRALLDDVDAAAQRTTLGVSVYDTETAQDAIGAMVGASLVYTDATPLLARAALTGDVTASANSNATTIGNNKVTYAKMQDVSATNRILGRSSAGSGDPEEITVGGDISQSGSTFTIANDVVTYAKMQNVSATDKVLGRSSAGSGDVEEIACTSFARSLIDDATAAAARTTLGISISSGSQGSGDNYVITPSVASNNLTVALKTLSGSDPSSSSPISFRVGNAVQTITSALSLTKNAGTNWAALGATELAGQDVDLFCYIIVETGASAGVKIGWSRIPWGQKVGDFSSTTTYERYLAGPTNYNSTDLVENIGRFNVSLSAGTSYNWSIPATAVVLNTPIRETRVLTWAPTITATTGTPTTVSAVVAQYRIGYNQFFYHLAIQVTNKGTAAGSIIATPPVAISAYTPVSGSEMYASGSGVAGAVGAGGNFQMLLYNSGTLWVNTYVPCIAGVVPLI